MKSLKIAVVACSLFATAVTAYAQTQASAANTPQRVAQTATPQVDTSAARRNAASPTDKTDGCVGPVSFCSIYSGS